MQAFYEMGQRETVLALAKEAAYRQLPDGRAAILGDDDAATDPCSAGEALAWAASQTRDPALENALGKLAEWARVRAPRSKEGIVYHIISAPEIWVDSMYMLPPFLAAIGQTDEAMRQINGYEHALLDRKAGLFSHRWDDGAGRFIRAAHWGVGNGWALAAYARMLRLAPEHREELARRAKRLIDALLPYMRPDGLFHDVVDDASSFVEGNLTQMLCYALCRGMADGWLDESYAGAADKLRAAALARVDAYGLAQGVCGAPSFDKPGVAPEGQAFLLMMETAHREWKHKETRERL